MISGSDLIILDGGMGKQLERSGAPFRQPEWSALALMEAPDAVRQAHADFIAAGADVIIVNSYAVVPFHIGQQRFDERGHELAALAGQLAREAADAADRSVRVAGSLPPLFGSYEPDLFDAERAPSLIDVLVQAQGPFVDFWIGETFSLIAEAEAAIAAIERHDPSAEVWIAFTLSDDFDEGDVPVLRSGESVRGAVAAVQDRAAAVLFNCSQPETMSPAIAEAVEALAGTSVGVGAYANAFDDRPSVYAANEAILGRRPDVTAEHYRDIAAGWVDLGATIIGGCCQVFPEDIAALATIRSASQ